MLVKKLRNNERYRKKIRFYITTHFSSVQIIVFYYLLMTIIAFFLLSLSFFQKEGVHVNVIDMMFMAVSSVSVTGLSTFDIGSVFNTRGIILLELIFQVGGLGIMMISTFFAIVSRRRVSLRQRQLIMTDMNQPKLSGSVRLIRISLFFILMLQAVFGVVFAINFLIRGYYSSVSEAIFNGFYQSVSAVTNSGFDITGDSIIPFAKDYFFIVCVMILIMVGGIGFPVIVEVSDFIRYRKKKTGIPFHFSLFTKLAVTSFIVLFIGGTLVIYLFERHNVFENLSVEHRWITSMFYSMSTRNAGMHINDISQFRTSTLLVFSILMFIGCSPSSVGGGVRTTTIAILVVHLFAFIKSEESTNIFGRRISKEDVTKATVVFDLSLVMCFFAVIVLSFTEKFSLIAIIMEVASAFGTTGLSLGITPDLTTGGKIVIAFLMFVGRIGMLYTLMIFVPKEQRDLSYNYPSERIIIG